MAGRACNYVLNIVRTFVAMSGANINVRSTRPFVGRVRMMVLNVTIAKFIFFLLFLMYQGGACSYKCLVRRECVFIV
jgi:hypothetical protein